MSVGVKYMSITVDSEMNVLSFTFNTKVSTFDLDSSNLENDIGATLHAHLKDLWGGTFNCDADVQQSVVLEKQLDFLAAEIYHYFTSKVNRYSTCVENISVHDYFKIFCKGL